MGMTFDHGRRAFIGIGPRRSAAPKECHISSLLVHVRPERQAEVAARISDLASAELQPSSVPGKLIVTLETGSTMEIMDCLEAIHEMPGIISAALVYHQWEREG